MPDRSTPPVTSERTRSVRIRPDDLASRRAGDETVILDLARSSYHALNASGVVLWERLADWTTTEELTAVLVGVFGISRSAAADDVEAFVDACADAGVIEVR